jgi:hypothetical protein
MTDFSHFRHPVGSFSLMPVERPDTLGLDLFWVLFEPQGKSLGRLMFERTVLESRKTGARRMKITAEPGAEGFCLKISAVRIGGKPKVAGGESHVLPLLELPLD